MFRKLKHAASVVLVTTLAAWLLLVGAVACSIAWFQLAPLSCWFVLREVRVVNNPLPTVIFQRWVRHDLRVETILEIHSATNNSDQFCSNTYTSIEEEGVRNDEVRTPLQNLMPNCNLQALVGQPLVLETTYVFALDYGIFRLDKQTSQPFVLSKPL